VNEQEIQVLKKEIIATSAYYQLKLDPQVIPMYADDLSDLPLTAVLQAYKSWRKNPKNFRFPLPGQIREIVCPEISSENEALEASARIIQAVTKFGWPNPNEAKLFIGLLGWRVVERFGGWTQVCNSMDNGNITALQAQFRNLARATTERHEIGLDNRPPALGEANKLFQLQMRNQNNLNEILIDDFNSDEGA
jgi:hypothetical protein